MRHAIVTISAVAAIVTCPNAADAAPQRAAGNAAVAPIVHVLAAQRDAADTQLTSQRRVLASLGTTAAAARARATELALAEQRMVLLQTLVPGRRATPRADGKSYLATQAAVADSAATAAEHRLAAATKRAAATQLIVTERTRQINALTAAVTAINHGVTAGGSAFPTHGWGGAQTGAVTPQTLDAYLASKASPLAGHGVDLMRSAVRYNIDPRLIVAISGAESTFGVITCAPYNAWGYGCPNGPVHFASWADAIDTVAHGLRANYLDDGLTSVAAIHLRYAPPAAANDPTGLNYAWPVNVSRFLVEQGGNPANVEGPGTGAAAVASS